MENDPLLTSIQQNLQNVQELMHYLLEYPNISVSTPDSNSTIQTTLSRSITPEEVPVAAQELSEVNSAELFENQETDSDFSSTADRWDSENEYDSEWDDEDDTRYMRRRAIVKIFLTFNPRPPLCDLIAEYDSEWYFILLGRFRHPFQYQWFESEDFIPPVIYTYIQTIRFTGDYELTSREIQLLLANGGPLIF